MPSASRSIINSESFAMQFFKYIYCSSVIFDGLPKDIFSYFIFILISFCLHIIFLFFPHLMEGSYLFIKLITNNPSSYYMFFLNFSLFYVNKISIDIYIYGTPFNSINITTKFRISTYIFSI